MPAWERLGGGCIWVRVARQVLVVGWEIDRGVFIVPGGDGRGRLGFGLLRPGVVGGIVSGGV